MNITTTSTLVAAGLALCLAGGASPDTAKGAAKEGVQLQKAVEAPLADLNLVQEKIPVVLEAAVKAPYALPSQRDCAALANEVRVLDGAERHSKEVAAAIAAGSVRRAFLKGVGQTLGCEAPAAPLQALAASAVSVVKN